MTYYITKYWQTKGIVVRDLDATEDGKYASNIENRVYGGEHWFVRLGRDAHATMDEARAAVANAAKRRLAALKKETVKVQTILGQFTKGTP